MSAPTESAASLSACACTNISLMQLFHELKQKFPSVPDHVVSSTIELYCHDKQACETQLHSEVKASLTHAYHASSSAAARHHETKLSAPVKCRNQPIFKHEALKPTAINAVTCEAPQTAILSTCSITDENENNKVNTDANQNVVEQKAFNNEEKINNLSPVTVINIDNCYAKYSADSPSDLELTNETPQSPKEQVSTPQSNPEPESTNYRILKSNKVRCNLHEKLEKGKGKKTITKEEPKVTVNKEEPKLQEEAQKTDPPSPKEQLQEKPKRPNTLDFIKPNPDIAFKPQQTESEPCRSVSPAPPRQEPTSAKEQTPSGAYRAERGFPVNVSVNVNCHMDYGYDLWPEEYNSPRPITSVNLTVCTPTSNMASPIREDEFEGHVLVTVSPSAVRAPPRRRAPPPPTVQPPAPAPERLEPRPTRAAPEPPDASYVPDRSLIERQKERLGRLARALAQERTRLAQLAREAHVLASPLPSPAQRQQLRDEVQRLRAQCDHLTKRVELSSAPTLEHEETGNFYNNIYTGQRPPASWKCHLCTFLNHPLLDKCEECDMPRILIVRGHDRVTVRLVPGRRKIVRSWVL